jgi:two-component system, OmpR family, sensor kinase
VRARWRSVTGSIRFRLSIWYAAIVLAVILAMGIAFSILLERELRSDVDVRVESTAQRVKSEIEVFVDQRQGEITRVRVPPPDFYSFPSLLIQVVEENGDVALSSENLYQADSQAPRVLPVSPAPSGSIDPVFSTAELDGVRLRTVSLPLVIQGDDDRQTIGFVNVGEPLIQLEQTLDHVRQLLAIGTALGVLFAAVAGWFLAGRALRPVDRITAAAAEIAEGQGVGRALSARLEVGRSGDELARLSETFNRMLNRLQETFESQRRFIADASHELRTPLTAIRGNVDVLARQMERDGSSDDDVDETIDDLRRESERMRRLIEDLLLLARTETTKADEDRRVLVELEEVAGEAIRVGSALAQGQRLELTVDAAATVTADRDRLFQVLLILIDNAIRYTPETGSVAVSSGIEGGSAVLRVADTGVGIAPEHLPHVFDRFYRADSSRQRGSGGTGLGLAIARAIVERHGGSIAIQSAPGSGTTVTVNLPPAATSLTPDGYNATPVPSD